MPATRTSPHTGRRPPGAATVRALGVLGDPSHAVSYVRFLQPFEHLRDAGFELVTLPPALDLTRTARGYEPSASLLDGVSLVLFPQMVLSPRLADGGRVRVVEAVCETARRRGIPVVYSPDDYLPEIDEANPAFEIVADSAANVRFLLETADAFFVTTHELDRTLTAWNKPTWVLPNAVDPVRWKRRPARSNELRVGWAGSSSHIDDLLMVVPALRALRQRLPVRVFVLGLVDRPLAQAVQETRHLLGQLSPSQRIRAEKFLDLARWLDELGAVHAPFGSLSDHFKKLPALDLDVGICPLLDTPYNRQKSALKFYEYAVTGTLTVASAVTPYREEVSVTVENEPCAWADALERHLRDSDLRRDALRDQRAFVLQERTIGKLRSRWRDALEAVLAVEPRRTEPTGTPEARFKM